MSQPGGSRFRRTAHNDPRRALIHRMQAQSVQIRKRRKEERIQARRMMGMAPVMNGTISSNETDTPQMNDIGMVLQTYLTANNDTLLPHKSPLIVTLEQLVMTTSGKEYMQQLLNDKSSCQALVTRICTDLHHPGCHLPALRTLQQLTTLPPTNNSYGTADSDASYYGRSPLTWPDVLAEHDILPTALLAMIASGSTTDTTNSTDSISEQDHVVEAAATVLGLVVQEQSSSGRALQICVAHWRELLHALPLSSFCCASILRQDQTTLGMTFFPAPSFNSPQYLIHLFQHQDTSVAVHAAWMLHGLSFREDAMVDFLCNDSSLLATLIQALESARVHNNRDLLVPIVQAVGNLVTANNGKYVATFLSQPVFVKTLSAILQQSQIVDAIPLAGCLLIDCGSMQHPSTTIGAPTLLPGLVQALCYVSYDWRSQAVEALATALAQPMKNQPFEPYLLQAIVQETLWQPVRIRVCLMESLASLIRVDNVNATIASLALLEILFRLIPESLRVFASVQGVRRLDELCNHTVSGQDRPFSRHDSMQLAQARAADLLDRYFEDDDEDDDDDDDNDASFLSGESQLPLAPLTTLDGRQFVFGLDPPALPPQFTFTAEASSTVAGQGRGRGRTMPAWMQTQQTSQSQP